MKSATNRDMGGTISAERPYCARLMRGHAQLTGPTEPSRTGALSGRIRRLLSFLAPSGRRPRGRPFAPASFASVALPCAAFLAALCLFAAPPASAQTTVWSATLTVADDATLGLLGCDDYSTTSNRCPRALSTVAFELSGTPYRVKRKRCGSPTSPIYRDTG